jgi:hypothetical protein
MAGQDRGREGEDEGSRTSRSVEGLLVSVAEFGFRRASPSTKTCRRDLREHAQGSPRISGQPKLTS